MKLLFLVGSLSEGGGIQKYSRDLIEALREERGMVAVIELKRSFFFTKVVFVLKVLLETFRFGPDVLICGHINFSPIGFFLKRLLGKHYIVATYGIEVWNVKNDFKSRCLKNADAITTISRYTRDRLLQQIPEVKNRLFLLPPAVEEDIFTSQKKPKHLVEKYNLAGSSIILTVSRLSSKEKYKGYDKLVETLPLIAREIPNVRYILVGDGDDSERVRRIVEDLGLSERVIMTGYVTKRDLVDYYNLCDVFAMPSTNEGFGIVFLEALACGKPVIAGNRDGSRDPLLDGKLGILIDPDNTKELAQALVSVLKKKISPSLLDPVYLRETVLGTYSFSKTKERVKTLLGFLSR